METETWSARQLGVDVLCRTGGGSLVFLSSKRSFCFLCLSCGMLLGATAACALAPPLLILIYWPASMK